MLKKCDNCKRDFLTEADLFVTQNKGKNGYYSCGCKEIKTWIETAEQLPTIKDLPFVTAEKGLYKGQWIYELWDDTDFFDELSEDEQLEYENWISIGKPCK